MSNIKKKYFMVIVLNLAIVVGFVSTFIIAKDHIKEILETSTLQISNKKIEWGIKRNKEHQQPDVGIKNKKILEENDGICMGNKEKKEIYITFDNGYEAGYTAKILDTLKENNVKAAFFITAHYLNTAPELVERMINEGHIVGNHIPVNSMYHKEKSYRN